MRISLRERAGADREDLEGFKKGGIESNYEPYPGVHRELKWPVQFLVQNNVAFQLKDVHYKALLKVKDKNWKKKLKKKNRGEQSYPQSVVTLLSRS